MGTSIVVVTFNKLGYTKRCINSIRKYTKDEDYEIIVVDNASSDDTVDWLKEQRDIICNYNNENLGFPKGCNIGIKLAKKDNDILLLNNDTIVTENWLANLRKALYSDENIGAVGPVSNSCPYYQQIDVDYSNIDEMHEFAHLYNKSNSNLWENRQKLIGFCMLIKRKALDEIGLLDERFSPGNYEDDDYSLRLLDYSYKLLLCKDTFIHHYGSVSFSENDRFKKILDDNRKKFKKKWGFYTEEELNIYKRYIDFIQGYNPNILELYCGSGATSLYIQNHISCNYYGYEKIFRIAPKYYRGEMKFVNNNLDIKYYDEKYDYLLISKVEEYIEDKELHEVNNYLLKPYTKIIVVIKDDNKKENQINKLLDIIGKGKYDLIDGVNEKNLISTKLNKSYLVFCNKIYEKIIECIKNEEYEEIISIITKDNRYVESVIRAVNLFSNNKIEMLNKLGLMAYENNIINCSEFFKEALEIDENHEDTLINYSNLFYNLKQFDLSYKYANRISNENPNKEILCEKILKESKNMNEIKFLLRRIEFNLDAESAVESLISLIDKGNANEEIIIQIVTVECINKIKVLNDLSVYLFQKEIYDYLIPLLNEAYKLDNNNLETNYNLAYVLNAFGAGDMALKYLEKLDKVNEEIKELMRYIKESINE